MTTSLQGTFVILTVLASAFLSGCPASTGGGGGSGSAADVVPSDPKAPFGKVTPRTTFLLRGKYPFVSASSFFAGQIGERSLGGRTFTAIKVGYDIASPAELATPGTKGAQVLVQLPSASEVVFGGVEDPGFTTVLLDPPVTLALRPPVGEKKTYEAKGTFQLSPSDAPKAATAKLEVTMVGDNVSVETGAGVVHGTRHYQGALTLAGEGIPDGLATTPIDGEIWDHPDLGVVAVKVPMIGAQIAMQGEQDYGPASSGQNYCKKTVTLDDKLASMTLSTYDRKGKLDADKTIHAKMYLELRFANDADAKSKGLSDAKQLQVQFATQMGSYSHTLLESPVSLLHPEDNGKGYKFFWAFVDQAAKNEPGPNGIAYKVTVSKPGGVAAVKVSARILYTLVP